MIRDVYIDMLWELEGSNLKVVLIPSRQPANRGACIRVAVESNCDWYRSLCKDFESNRKRQYKKFKTKVKRREIIRILNRLIDGNPCNSVYAEWLTLYAKAAEAEWDMSMF